VVFGLIGLERSGKDREFKNRGLALAGVIMGALAAVMTSVLLLTN
jgi:hypothetical protein